MEQERFKLEGWSIVPGGAQIRPPFHSTLLKGVTNYQLATVAAAILAVPGARLVHDSEPDWWQWRARWTFGDVFIDIAMTTWGPFGEPGWGGVGLSGSAGPHALQVFYAKVHDALPCAWLHNDECELHTSASFLDRFGAV